MYKINEMECNFGMNTCSDVCIKSLNQIFVQLTLSSASVSLLIQQVAVLDVPEHLVGASAGVTHSAGLSSAQTVASLGPSSGAGLKNKVC